MELIAPHAGEYFAKIAEPETKKDIRKLSFTNCIDLIAYLILLFKNCSLSEQSTPFKSNGSIQTVIQAILDEAKKQK